MANWLFEEIKSVSNRVGEAGDAGSAGVAGNLCLFINFFHIKFLTAVEP